MEQQLLEALKISSLELISLVGPLLVIGALLGIMEHKANWYVFAALGNKGILATAWLGTPVHELGHALMCLIFGHKIIDLKLLIFNRADGTLGYVSHSYDPKSVYQTAGNFFIGIAPIISGLGALFLGLYFLLPHSFQVFEVSLQANVLAKPSELALIKGLANSSLVLSQSLFTTSNLFNPEFWIFLLIAISISSHMALSWADIKGATQGLVMLYIVLFMITLLGNYLGVNAYSYISQVDRCNAYLLSFSVLALICSILTLGLSFIIYHLKIPRQL
jgi:hypothetical protein